MPEEQELVAKYLPQLNEAVAELITRSAIHALVGIHYHAHRRASEFVQALPSERSVAHF